jgi:hypothetical protein
MPKKIVFLNLADMNEQGLARTSVAALQTKYPRAGALYEFIFGGNEVTLVDLFDLLKWQKRPPSTTPLVHLGLSGLLFDPQLFRLVNDRVRIIEQCAAADKIMLGIHGRFGDNSNGYAGLGWSMGQGVIGTCDDFAQLVGGLLKPDRDYKLALIMCYGARAQSYRKDHSGALDPTDIKSSFAYQFYIRICTKARVTMTARTGSVEFDRTTGKSLVQTEAAAQADINNVEFQRTGEASRIDAAYKRAEREAAERGELEAFRDAEDFVTEAPQTRGKVPTLEAQQLIRKYHDVIEEYHEANSKVMDWQVQASESAAKTGKFVYQYDRGTVTVSRKYSDGRKVMEVLYQGPP